MEQARIALEFVTPCFLGGARTPGGKLEEAEWRSASVRGQLRWWFRAVAGGWLQGDLDAVKRLEAEHFGSTAASSPLRVRALGAPDVVPVGSRPGWGRPLSDRALAQGWGLQEGSPEWAAALPRLMMQWAVNPLLYLGYGCLKALKGGQWHLERSCIAPGQAATLELAWRRPRAVASGQPDLWRAALWCWLNLGGLGSRSRRGFGGLCALPAAADSGTPSRQSRQQFAEEARLLLAPLLRATLQGSTPEWSHFSDQSLVFLGAERASSWDDAMVRAGGWLMAFRRRYGYPGDSRTLGSTPAANRDYVWAGFPRPRKRPSGRVPDRAGFGLPLPFGDQIVTWGNGGKDRRRASPLLLHIAHLEEGFFPVLTFLPARLVPNGETLRFKGLPQPVMPPTAEQKSIVRHFLEDLARKRLVEPLR